MPSAARSLAARLGITSVPRDELKRRYRQSGSRFVQIMGADVHHIDEGTDTGTSPIVMIHGFASSLHTWNGTATCFARPANVLREVQD
ncbi:hypothetical protein [Paraburkholderia franconis]|uniref:hypothetical protein n=1 Tax=Paraburkholderia franconis TaxID=2654983 RepID=UPI001D10ED18